MKIAALLNGRAKRVTARVERDLRRALPDSLVLVSHDFDEASAHADRIAADRPDVVHVHNTFPLLSPAVYRAATRRHLP